MLILGKISGVFGVKGWVKLFSYTSPKQQIVKYSPVYMRTKQGWQTVNIIKGQKQGKGVVAQLEGVDDRDQAFSLIGAEIGIERDQLPKLSAGGHYWTDLEGLIVVTKENIELGKVDWLFDTGGNDVLVVKGDKKHMIPWIEDDVIISVDLEQSRIVVDWDPDF
jgi:16S rRNA processing protein RimM